MKATGTITAHLNPVFAASGSGTVVATLSWTSEGAQEVEVRVDAPDGPLLSRTAGSGAATTGRWLRDGTVFYLQDVSGGAPLTAEHTLATVTVTVSRQFDHSGPKALILLYHRVADIQPDPWSQCVTPRHFAEHLEVLSAQWHVLRLGELVRALEDGSIPDRSVVITLDDGYAGNLHCVKPLLERYGTPATVFVASGPVGKPREFWWDQLERSVLRDGNLQLDLYRSLYHLLRPLPDAERRQVLDQLREWAGIEPAVRATHRPLTAEELTELARGELVEIGAHTITHPVLAELPESQQRAEIQGGKARLEELLGRRVRHFACPYGSFSEATPEIVRKAGFESACCRSAMVVDKYAFPFLLPRLVVQNWDGEEFARRLSEWYGSEVLGDLRDRDGSRVSGGSGAAPGGTARRGLAAKPGAPVAPGRRGSAPDRAGTACLSGSVRLQPQSVPQPAGLEGDAAVAQVPLGSGSEERPVSSFLKWLGQVPWKSARALAPSARSLGSYELTFPNLESYVPPELVRPFQPASVDAGGGAPVQTIPRQTKYDLVFLPPFEFDFRFQRPQQLAIQFARSGHRVFWVSPSRRLPAASEEPCGVLPLRENLWEVHLRSRCPNIYTGALHDDDAEALLDCLRHLYREWAIAESAVMVDLPFWRAIGLGLRAAFGSRLVFDCMDDWESMPMISEFTRNQERLLVAESDLLVFSSQQLLTKYGDAARRCVLARNAADFALFEAALSRGQAGRSAQAGGGVHWRDRRLVRLRSAAPGGGVASPVFVRVDRSQGAGKRRRRTEDRTAWQVPERVSHGTQTLQLSFLPIFATSTPASFLS